MSEEREVSFHANAHNELFAAFVQEASVSRSMIFRQRLFCLVLKF